MAFRFTPQDTSFFTLFATSANLLVDATSELPGLLDVDRAKRKEITSRLDRLEHEADEATHELIRKVNSSFITPFDREDIHHLAAALDDCMDHIEEAADMIVLYKIDELPGRMAELFEILGQMAQSTADAMPKLRTVGELPSYWIEINRLENQADKLHRKMMSELFSKEDDAIAVIKMKDIIDVFEEAADAFERAAHMVETIAVKES